MRNKIDTPRRPHGLGRRLGGPTDFRHPRGQSLVEFALVLPMLLVLLLGIADFGRVFAAGITVEAAARNGAEAAAQEYLQLLQKNGGTLSTVDYQRVHQAALDRVCGDAETLPNKVGPGGACSMPLTAVCVHDGIDLAGCGVEKDPSVAQCDEVNAGWSDVNAGASPLGAAPLPYVEVRVCYRFTTLFNLTDLRLPLGWNLTLGEVYLQKDREFTVASY